MKTRAKILLGMVVVLAMMVFAAPAMAQSDEITVNTTNESIYNYYAGERNATDLSVTVFLRISVECC